MNENNSQARSRRINIEAVRDRDDQCFMSRMNWVLFMTIQFCNYELHSVEAMFFMTRVQYILANSDIGQGISICWYYQIDLELLLDRGFANKTKFETTLDFLFWIAFNETDREVLAIFSRRTVWMAFLELSLLELGDRFEFSNWRIVASRMRRAIHDARIRLQ